MKRATGELLDGTRGQRERLVNPAGESVGGAESRGDDRCPEDLLPRSAEVEIPFKDADRAREIPATKVGEPEFKQSEVHRQEMIDRFRDLHSGLGMPDGLVEPAKLGEHGGEACPGERPG
jgi:hypothetical protein